METEEKVRVTLVMPKSTDRKIEVYAAFTGQAKNVVVTTALDAFLNDTGLPLEPPKALGRAAGDNNDGNSGRSRQT